AMTDAWAKTLSRCSRAVKLAELKPNAKTVEGTRRGCPARCAIVGQFDRHGAAVCLSYALVGNGRNDIVSAASPERERMSRLLRFVAIEVLALFATAAHCRP